MYNVKESLRHMMQHDEVLVEGIAKCCLPRNEGVYRDGQLVVTSRQLVWEPFEPGQAKLDLAVTGITGALQKSKAKPLLRIPYTGGHAVLEFQSALERDAALDTLATLVKQKGGAAVSCKPTGPLAAVKQQLLDEDRDLKALFDQLVVTGVLPEAEFWKGRQDLLRKKQGEQGTKPQQAGLSSTLITTLTRTEDGGQKAVLTITPEFKAQIFAEKPGVHRAFLENVPEKVDEQNFWRRYATHQRRKLAAKGKAKAADLDPEDPMFKGADRAVAGQVVPGRVDPTVNLAADQYDSISSTRFAAEGEGSAELARELNRHAAVVLQGPAHAQRQGFPTLNPSKPDDDDRLPEWDWRPRTGSAMEDLGTTMPPEPARLSIRHPRDLPNGAAKAAAGPLFDSEAVIAALGTGFSGRVMDGQAALAVLEEGRVAQEAGAAEWGLQGSNAGGMPVIRTELQANLRQLAMTINELLRHFWACFPLTAQRHRKAERLKQALSDLYDRALSVQSTVQGTDRIHATQLLRPIIRALDAAIEKFQTASASAAGV